MNDRAECRDELSCRRLASLPILFTSAKQDQKEVVGHRRGYGGSGFDHNAHGTKCAAPAARETGRMAEPGPWGSDGRDFAGASMPD